MNEKCVDYIQKRKTNTDPAVAGAASGFVIVKTSIPNPSPFRVYF